MIRPLVIPEKPGWLNLFEIFPLHDNDVTIVRDVGHPDVVALLLDYDSGDVFIPGNVGYVIPRLKLGCFVDGFSLHFYVWV